MKKLFIAGWLLITGFRSLMVALLPLDLSGDEAYYWEWGRQLDWGYYSKPPGIAWLMALAGRLGGNTTSGIRLFAVLLGSGGLWFFYVLGCRLYGVRVGVAAGFLFALLPASAVLNFVLTIDAPLMFCWTGALLAFWRFIESEGKSLPWGGGLALFLAGGILSKQMMFIFYPLAVLFLILNPSRRSVLKSKRLWGVFLASMVALLPPLYWNSRNHWLTFQHTLHHFESGSVSLLHHLSWFLEFIGASLGLMTPIIWVLVMGLLSVSLFSWKHLGERERYLWLFSAPGMFILTLMALRQRVHPNWPAVYLPAAVLLTTAWAAGKWTPVRGMAGWQRAYRPAYMVAIFFFFLTYGLVTVSALGWIFEPGHDPLGRIRGWRQLAGEVAVTHSSLPNAGETMIITQGHRFTASELAFYLPGHPRVYCYHSHARAVVSQHDLWVTPAAHIGKDALIIVQGLPDDISPELKSRFEAVRFLKEIGHGATEHHKRRYALFQGLNLQAWPDGGILEPGVSK